MKMLPVSQLSRADATLERLKLKKRRVNENNK